MVDIVENYFTRKGIEIWSNNKNDIEGIKGPLYLNVITNSDGYLIIMSIRGTPKMVYKQIEQFNDEDIKKMWIEVQNKNVEVDEKICSIDSFCRYWSGYKLGDRFNSLIN